MKENTKVYKGIIVVLALAVVVVGVLLAMRTFAPSNDSLLGGASSNDSLLEDASNIDSLLEGLPAGSVVERNSDGSIDVTTEDGEFTEGTEIYRGEEAPQGAETSGGGNASSE